ncbi:MAG: hypothetical protein AAGF59_07985 [Pseudomonadota bacterium]
MQATLIDEFGLGGFLLLLHLVPMAVAILIWCNKRIARRWVSVLFDCLGLFATPVALIILFVVSEDQYPGGSAGHPAGWFLIFSMLTLGVLPLLTLASCFCSGRFVGRAVHWFRRRQWYVPG